MHIVWCYKISYLGQVVVAGDWCAVIDTDCEVESPTSLLWTLSYLAQHFDYLRQSDRALEYINAALDHTMTLIELYVIKARIYKVTSHSQFTIAVADTEMTYVDSELRYVSVNSSCVVYYTATLL